MNPDLFESGDKATPLDEEEQRGLIPSILSRAELNRLERANINQARVWAMKPRNLRRTDLLTDALAHELHRRMFNGVWRWAGQYRTTERNLGWEVHRLTEGVHNALADAQAWLDHATYTLPEIAVRLHHQLIVIHPWPNGNGRHARLLADLVIAAKGGTELTWGAVDLAEASVVRQRYIAAMQQADQGNFAPLLAFAPS